MTNTQNTPKRISATPKNIFRIIALCLIVLVFCPSFIVSCAGEDMNITAFTAAGGLEMDGEQLVEPNPIALLCLLIPIALLVITFIKQIKGATVTLITAAGALLDLIVWFVFSSKVKSYAGQFYCESRVTFWYVLTVILLFVMLITAILVVLGILKYNGSITSAPNAAPAAPAVDPVPPIPESPIPDPQPTEPSDDETK